MNYYFVYSRSGFDTDFSVSIHTMDLPEKMDDAFYDSLPADILHSRIIRAKDKIEAIEQFNKYWQYK